MSSQVGLIVGLSTVLVVVIYLIAASSQDAPLPVQSSLPAPGEAPAELTPDVAQRVAALRREIAVEADQAVRHQKQHELVDLLSSAGRLDQAGEEQERIAGESSTADAWARAGNLYFDWMRVREGDEKELFAEKTIAAYLNSLEIDSTNLGVRTDLGVAYQYDPENAHLALLEIEAVLRIDPVHRIAGYNRGVMLVRAERVEEAIRQFETVTALLPPEDALHRQSQDWLTALREAEPGTR